MNQQENNAYVQAMLAKREEQTKEWEKIQAKRKAKLDKFKSEQLIRIPTLSNKELYDEYMSLIPGDDYDGCFTDEGSIEIAILGEEFDKRLNEVNFFTIR